MESPNIYNISENLYSELDKLEKYCFALTVLTSQRLTNQPTCRQSNPPFICQLLILSSMSEDSDMVFAGDERRELAYSMGKGAGKIPLSGFFVRPMVWIYSNIMLRFVPIIFSLIRKRNLGERMAADNREILKELMAGFRGEDSPSGMGSD